MKKIMLLALAALSVSVAQAVTISWELTNTKLYDCDLTAQSTINWAVYAGSVAGMNSTNISDYVSFTQGSGFGAASDSSLSLVTSGSTNFVDLGTGANNYTSRATVTLSGSTTGAAAASSYTFVVADKWWYYGGTNGSATDESRSYAAVITVTLPETVSDDAVITISGDGFAGKA